MVPIIGDCWIGIKPGDKVIGISKFARVADWVFLDLIYKKKR